MTRSTLTVKVTDLIVRATTLAVVTAAMCLLSFQHAEAANKFWIAASPGSFNVDANWSLSSGGPANTTAPGASDTINFDGGGIGNCAITSTVTVQAFVVGSGYPVDPAMNIGTINVSSGVNFTVSGNFQMGGGTFNASNGTFTSGDITLLFHQTGGVFNGNGTIDIEAWDARIEGGIFNATPGNTTFHRTLVRTAGIFNHNNGTVILNTDQSGGGMNFVGPASQTFKNLTINNVGCCAGIGGLTVVEGTLRLISGEVNSSPFEVQGDVVIENTFAGGSSTIKFTGQNDQSFTNNGGANFNGTWTIDKTARRVTLLSDLNLPSQQLDVTSGILDQGLSGNLTVGSITIGSAGGSIGRLTNQGAGDLTLGGPLTVNSGSTITLNGGGGGCTDADSILVRSSVSGTPRTWTGSGNFFLTDVDVKDQTAANPPGNINVFSGTDAAPGGTNTNFTFLSGCNPTVAGTLISGRLLDVNGNPIEGAVVKLSGTQNRKSITDANGNYQFDAVETNGFYTVTPSRLNYDFSPSTHAFSALGAHTEASFSATANGAHENPLDATEYFVRQQYVDFLGREPDESGFNFWVNNIESCDNDVRCREVKRIDTSAAFFLAIEFQQTGYLVYRLYQAAYGDMENAPVPMTLGEFKPDAAEISQGVIVNQNGWQDVLETNKRTFAEDLVQRSRFVSAYPTTMTPVQFVDKLFQTAGLAPDLAERAAAINEFDAAANSGDVAARGRALRRVAENRALQIREFNQAFVLMEYFGYLRRGPNEAPEAGLNYDGYNFWLQKLESFNGNYNDAEMVKAFLLATEYRGRFPR